MKTPAFDIFQVQDSGVLWVGSALTLDEAQEHVRQIAGYASGEYQRLPEKIQSVETLVLERLQQLDQGNDSRVEKIALHDALSIIRIMKRDRLA
jgi:hypothetical protein